MNIALVSGLIILILLVIMLIAGVPIAVAPGISSVVAILPIMDLEVAVVTGAQRIFSGISMFSLLAIPFFILAGNIMNKGGIAVRLINLAKLITGRAPGALAQTNVIANMLFGAISGSGTAAASAMGSIIGPIEKEEGYDPNFSAAANNTSTFPVDENGDPVFYLLENTVALPEAGILLVPISLETLLDEL